MAEATPAPSTQGRTRSGQVPCRSVRSAARCYGLWLPLLLPARTDNQSGLTIAIKADRDRSRLRVGRM